MSKTFQKRLDRIEAALQVLYEEGLKGYKDEYQKEIPRMQAIGKAFAAVSDNITGMVQLAYEFFEDWNAHDLNAVLSWSHPIVEGYTFHVSDFQRLSRMMNKTRVPVILNWDNDGKPVTKIYNVKIVFEEVTDEPEPP